MAVNLTSPVTGLVMTGFTAPTYTNGADQAPAVNAKQWAVSALGGTQTGVTAHSIASPFYITVWRPAVFKYLGKPNPVTGLLPSVPTNVFSFNTIKGVSVLSGQPYAFMRIKTLIEVPAGADTYDAANVKAALGCHGGALSQIGVGLGDSLLSGVL